MASISDVANWFLAKEPITPKKLQKLCYYYKAWGLALYDADFIPESDFQAWIHGPVCQELYQKYGDLGWQQIPKYTGTVYPFNKDEEEVLESVWLTYRNMSANALEAQTRLEAPWRNARIGLAEFQRSERVISTDDMKAFYRELYKQYQGETK